MIQYAIKIQLFNITVEHDPGLIESEVYTIDQRYVDWGTTWYVVDSE